MIGWLDRLPLVQWLDVSAECTRRDFAYTGFFAVVALVLSTLLIVEAMKAEPITTAAPSKHSATWTGHCNKDWPLQQTRKTRNSGSEANEEQKRRNVAHD